MSTTENDVRIENWSLVDRNPNEFLRLPECAIVCLHGTMYGHPGVADGTTTSTSPIVGRDGNVVVCKSRRYTLGAVHPDYERTNPGAKARLLAQIDKVSAARTPSPQGGTVGGGK